MRGLLTSDYVRTIVALAECGSFSKAAAHLGISQPAVSQQIRRIEDEIGRQLFVRNARRLAITPDGEALLVFARTMTEIGAAAHRHFMQPRSDGALRIGLLEGVARTLLMRFLAVFSTQFPAFVFDIGCDTSHRLFEDLDNGKYDVVISAAIPAQPRGELLRRFPLVWIGSKNLVEPLRDPVPLVLPPAPDGLRDSALQALSEAGRTWRINVQSESLAVVEAAVGAGLGVSIMVPNARLHEAVHVSNAVGLPPLPDRLLVIDRRGPTLGDGGIDAMYALLRSGFLRVIEMTITDDEEVAESSNKQ